MRAFLEVSISKQALFMSQASAAASAYAWVWADAAAEEVAKKERPSEIAGRQIPEGGWRKLI